MKKIVLLVISIILISGCGDMLNTPTKRVEELLGKYQTLDKDITTEINNLVDDSDLSTESSDRYRKLIEKQYKNLTYDIKDEEIDGENAIVTVQIEVLDFKTAINNIDVTDMSADDFNDAKLNALEKVKDKVKYTLKIPTVKKDKTWEISALSSSDIKKIQGMY